MLLMLPGERKFGLAMDFLMSYGQEACRRPADPLANWDEFKKLSEMSKKALALRACAAHPTAARIGVITHARRDLVHYQAFACAINALPAPLAAVDLIPPQEAAQHLRDDGVQAVIGSALARHTVFANMGIPVCADTQPQATDLWALAKAADYKHEDIAPLYVRPCDAVENLDHIARKQGMDPATAHERLNALLSAPPPI